VFLAKVDMVLLVTDGVIGDGGVSIYGKFSGELAEGVGCPLGQCILIVFGVILKREFGYTFGGGGCFF
jgi:hypothetical protein